VIKYLVILLTVALLSGCAEFTAMKSAVGFYGAQASDDALDVAIWTVCKATPVGAISRRFKTAEQMETWALLCSDVKEPIQ
jgi:hypothetical protein